ncbi:hypothetical protein ACQKII_17325 [Lysinibacillus sp. NPDC048646]|uniref:hypothetical protein n=1 Tax=Lysinibacillus sp. NPDC048646 TaxID=3390574 RepID=UPI003D008D76
MRDENFKEFKKEGHQRGERHEGRDGSHHRGGRYKGRDGSHQRGPKTFRRGRAIAFLEMMNVKRSTIKQQLELPEFQSIQAILVGELKAIDMIINEFTQLFEIHEGEAMDTSGENVETENSKLGSEKSFDNGKEELKISENN